MWLYQIPTPADDAFQLHSLNRNGLAKSHSPLSVSEDGGQGIPEYHGIGTRSLACMPTLGIYWCALITCPVKMQGGRDLVWPGAQL